MKNKLKYTFLLPLLAFVACSNEDDALTTTTQTSTALEITVRAGDFAEDGVPGTRAADNGATTAFENGDRMGIIILDANNGNILADNIPYRYNGSVWSFDSSNGEGKSPCYYYKNATYIAYFPYSPAANGVKTTGDLKSKFPPLADQRTENAYRASDLMTAGGSLSGKDLSVTLTHAYASVSLAPTSKYSQLDDGENTACSTSYSPGISDVSLTVDDDVYIAYPAEDGSFRCILPASITPDEIRCFYTVGSKTYGNAINISEAVAANTRYTSTPEIDLRTYTLDDARVGDFYCKRSSDNKGYLIPGGDAVSLTDAQKQACVGVIYCVDKSFITNNSTKKTDGGYTHGLVVALKEISSTYTWNNRNNALNGLGSVPSGSSPWYVPNIEELKYICWGNIYNPCTDGKTMLDTQFSKLGSTYATNFSDSALYWSSTENSNVSSNAFTVSFVRGTVDDYFKNANARVRCVLAF